MQIENLNEIIKVRADFLPGKIIPVCFQRNGRRYTVSKVHTSWSDRDGLYKCVYFAIEAKSDCDTGTYEIHFNSKDFLWHLDRVVL